MAQYVSIRFYKLHADADAAAFEQAFHNVQPTLGVERIMLLRGLPSNNVDLAPSDFDYGSIHIYASLEEATNTVRLANAMLDEPEIPQALRPFIHFWRTVHSTPIAEGQVNGFTLISNAP